MEAVRAANCLLDTYLVMNTKITKIVNIGLGGIGHGDRFRAE